MELEILKRSFFRRLSLLLPGLLLFAACEKEANIKLPEVPPRLVVVGFITPQDTMIKVRITKSSPIFQLNQVDVHMPVTDATVTIFGNSTSIQLTYDNLQGIYVVPASQFPIYAGNEYRVEASAPGVETVTATTTVPGAVPADFAASMTYTIDSSLVYIWRYAIELNESFTDFPGEGDYYRIHERAVLWDDFSMDTVHWIMGNGELFSDESVNRQQQITMDLNHDVSWGVQDLVAMEVYLLHTSREYHLYHHALNNYTGSGDPFSEPSLMYTNVEKGYGVFAGANYVKKRLNF
jgi:hypothetical protein